ncbi:MAG: hypothetical protein M9888_04780 [Chitinophagales bacterium]|nr:hypothetical protein [Chitinophagales bacterium]
MIKERSWTYKMMIVITILMGFNTLFAQNTQVSFGQNRVQYHDFDWVSYESEHFITYYYPGGQELGKFIITAAENGIQELEDQLNFTYGSKIEILIYNDITDLSQTNIGIAENTYNVGGTNISDEAKIFLYFNGNHRDMLNMLRRELTKVYLNSMMAGQNFFESVQNSVFLNLPNWYISGLANFIGTGWNTQNDDSLRNFWNHTSSPSFSKLAKEDATLAGHALWFYVYEKYGSHAIKNILYLTRIYRSTNKGLVHSIGKTLEELIKEWETYCQFHSKNDILDRTIPDKKNEVKIKTRKKQNISEVKISPDGQSIAFAKHKQGAYRVYIQNILTHKKKKIFSGGFNSDNYPYDQSYPILTWHPNGTQLIGIHEKRDQIKMIRYQLDEKKKVKEDIRGFQRIYQTNFSPDGQSLVFSAQNKGQTDIFLYHLPTMRITQLTNDIFDDSYPIMINLAGTNGIVYSSNRPNAKTEKNNIDSILPIGNTNLYFLSLAPNYKKLIAITSEKQGNQIQATKLNDQEIIYLSDKNGIYNLYKSHLEPILFSIDSIVDGDKLYLDSLYTLNVASTSITNISSNIIEYSISTKTNQWLFLTKEMKKKAAFLEPIPQLEWIANLKNTEFRNSLTSLKNGVSSITDNLLQDSTSQTVEKKELDSLLTPTNFKFTFHSKYNYSLPTQSEKNERHKQYIDSLKSIYGDEEFTYPELEGRAITQYRPGGSVSYRAKFSSSFLTTQLDNSVLPFSYQSVAQNGSRFDYPELSGMITFGIQDLMEDHKLIGGFRLPSNFKGTELFISYENLKKRLDKRLLFYRKSNQERYSLLVNNIFLIPAIGKQKTNYAEVRLSYPFDVTKSLRLYSGVRNDRLILGYTDTITMIADVDRKENWSFLKLEFVHDNSKEISENIYNGFRYKIYTEYFKNWNQKKSNLFTFGFDARHYTTIYKNFIWANRFAGASSFGQKKVIYYLGGVDTWLNNKYNDDISIASNQDFAFQAQATNVRGFPINIRNGNSAFVINSELRLPLFSFISKKPIKSSFIRNFQLISFFDIGTAYNGLLPFNKKNPYIQQQITPDGTSTPVVVWAEYFRNPTVMGTGVGARTTLLGYFIRMDIAWGIDGGIVSKKPMWMFSLSKDF